MSAFRVELLLLRFNPASPKAKLPLIIPVRSRLKLVSPSSPSSNTTARKLMEKLAATPKRKTFSSGGGGVISKENSRMVMAVAVSVGIALLLMGFDDGKALALGPEGPLMEDFWDNMRRYALYALTVSTGAIYTLLEPIVELLKNPISAVLILLILGGGFYIVSQVVTAMVGLSDFSYDYNY